MTAYSKRRRSFPLVSPGVERLHRHIEVSGEFVDAEQAVFVFHPVIVWEDPVKPMSIHGHHGWDSEPHRGHDAHCRIE